MVKNHSIVLKLMFGAATQYPTATGMMTNSSIAYNMATGNHAVGRSVGFILGFSLVLTNAIGIYILHTSKTIAKQIRTMIFHLSLSDLMLGIFVVLMNRIDHMIPPLWYSVIGKLLVLVSHLFTACLSIDRMISVWDPNWYLLHVTEETTALLCRIIWAVQSAISVATLFLLAMKVSYLEQTCDIGSLIVYIVVSVTVANSSYQIYKHGYKQFKRLKGFGDIKPKSFFWTNYKATIILLSLCMSMIILNLPVVSFNLVKLINFDLYLKVTQTRALQAARLIALLNHFINTFLYTFRFKECRERLTTMFTPSCCRQQRPLRKRNVIRSSHNATNSMLDDEIKTTTSENVFIVCKTMQPTMIN